MEIISKNIIKLTCFLGLILGAIASIPSILILYVTFFMFFLSAPAMIIYLKKKALYTCDTYQQAAFFGAVIGIVTTISFMVSFIPLCLILLALIPHNTYMIALRSLLSFQALWLVIIIIFMLSIISAGTNSVSAMGVQYLLSINIKKTFDQIMSEKKDNGNKFKN